MRNPQHGWCKIMRIRSTDAGRSPKSVQFFTVMLHASAAISGPCRDPAESSNFLHHSSARSNNFSLRTLLECQGDAARQSIMARGAKQGASQQRDQIDLNADISRQLA